MERQLVYIAIQTPDGTILESKHGHDYVTHTDANGIFYMLDGGPGGGYNRWSGDGQEKWIKVFSDDPFEIVRDHFKWGRNYDKDMNLLPKTEWIKLKDITDDHLDALLVYPRAVRWAHELFIKEQQYREKETGLR